ncbi:MAG: cytochrome c [Rhodothermales bacterium]
MDLTKYVFVSLALCGIVFSGCERASLVDSDELQPTLTDIQANIFDTSCALSGCHGNASPQLGQDLSAGQSFSNIVNVPSVEQPSLLRVKPGDPEDSYLFRKIRGDANIAGAQMPLGRSPLSAEQIALVESWILDGALDN